MTLAQLLCNISSRTHVGCGCLCMYIAYRRIVHVCDAAEWRFLERASVGLAFVMVVVVVVVELGQICCPCVCMVLVLSLAVYIYRFTGSLVNLKRCA